MAVGVRVGSIVDEIGASSFLHSFFSTISRYGEPNGWGSAFPCLINYLYQGRLPAALVPQALQELHSAKTVLSNHPPSAVVWDIEDPGARPPWGDNISPSITHLGNYFVTSTGRDLFLVLDECLSEAATLGKDVTIE